MGAGRRGVDHPFSRHCEPTGPAFGRLDDRLREAIQGHAALYDEGWIASLTLAMTPRMPALVDRNHTRENSNSALMAFQSL